jgi:hypothetical protein
MKYLFTLMITLLFSTLAISQSHYQDVVYLKNGSIIRGTIIEQVPNQSIKIETVDRNVFFFKMDEIEKFTREPHQGRSTAQSPRENISSRLETGYVKIAEFGYQVGVGDLKGNRFKFDFINAYQFNPHFSAGLGTGLRYYYETDEVLLPVFADLRAIVLDRPISPYFAFGFGYSFNLTDNVRPVGLLINPSAGVTFPVFERSLMNIGLGYEVQRARYQIEWPMNYSWHENIGAISLQVGLTF